MFRISAQFIICIPTRDSNRGPQQSNEQGIEENQLSPTILDKRSCVTGGEGGKSGGGTRSCVLDCSLVFCRSIEFFIRSAQETHVG